MREHFEDQHYLQYSKCKDFVKKWYCIVTYKLFAINKSKSNYEMHIPIKSRKDTLELSDLKKSMTQPTEYFEHNSLQEECL